MNFKKHVCISVISDMVTDQRVHRTATTLIETGFNVTVLCRALPDSLPVTLQKYKINRFRMIFNKGALFYSFFNIRLFFILLFKKTDLLFSNDLDTLPANYLVSKLRNIPLIYDSHEFFTGVPELKNRKLVRMVWEFIEQLILPRLKYTITVSESVANLYFEKYGIKMTVIRNLPFLKSIYEKTENNSPYIIYQGAVNKDRGLEEIIEAMNYIDNYTLKIVGDGDLFTSLKNKVQLAKMDTKIHFAGKIPFTELHTLTCNASIGISIEKNTCQNYNSALPNKLFDYIQAQIPVLVSPLPEMEKIVQKYNIGCVLPDQNPQTIASFITNMLTDSRKYTEWKANLEIAAQELNWENEKHKLEQICNNIFFPYFCTSV